MSRARLAFATAIACLIVLPFEVRAQPNSEKASQVSGPAPEPPVPPKAVKDSVKAAKAKAKAKKAAKADSAQAAGSAGSGPSASVPPSPTQTAPAPAAAAVPAAGAVPAASVPATSAPAKVDSAKSPVVDSAQQGAAGALPAAPPTGIPDSSRTKSASADSAQAPRDAVEAKAEPVRAPQDLRLFNDPPLIGREYGFAILGSAVAGTLCFYIGSGIETAIVGNSKAHKGTLSFTGIRYDNFKGAFWGGSAGLILGSALTTYFTGQTDEEDGGFFATLAGTTAAAAGAFYVASLMGVNDDIDWKPFMPLLAIPSLGGTLGFNLSRWFHDHEREKVVGKEAAVRLHAPSLAWGVGPGGEGVRLTALRLTF